jgi:hypothetical protein
MILQTQSIEDGLMTVAGTDLLTFLNQRYAWYLTNQSSGSPTTDDSNPITDYVREDKVPGQFIADAVTVMAIAPIPFPPYYSPVDLDWDNERIDHLSLGAVDTTGTPKRLTLPIGPLYDGIARIAVDEGLGLSLYLESADRLAGYSLKFTTYRGVDHTTDGTAPLVRLTPALDSIQNLKEVRSIQEFKNVAYVYYAGSLTKHLLDPTAPEPTGFDRRVIVVNAEGSPTATTPRTVYGISGAMPTSWTQIVVGPSDVAAFREQNAKDAFANHNYIRAIDGESSPISDYVYGVHYGLGDTIELEGLTGTITKARVTEYIKSQDKTGEKAYPTISVVSDISAESTP